MSRFKSILAVDEHVITIPVIYELRSLKTLLILSTTVGKTIEKKSPEIDIRINPLPFSTIPKVYSNAAILNDRSTVFKYPLFSTTNPPISLPNANIP